MTVTNVTPPTLSGSGVVGHQLLSSTGTWTSDDPPITYTYQWQRCDSMGANCVDIGGATSAAYTVVSADVGSKLRSKVVAADGGGAPTYGASLPARLPESTGSTTVVTTLNQLTSAIASASDGDIIQISGTISGGGATLSIGRDATALAPITIQGGKLSGFTRVSVSGASYVWLRGIEITAFTGDGIKIDGGSHHIEIDGCHVHHGYRQGILVGSSTAVSTNIQLWNNTINNCGNTTSLDHGIYFNTTSTDCVIANNLIYDNWAYNVQIYPNSPGVIYTCNTIDGGIVQPNARGGTVLSSEANLTDDTITVGYIGTNAAGWGFNAAHPGTGNNVYDSLGFGNGSGDFRTDAGVTYTNCDHADPLYVNRAAKDYHLQGGSPAIDHIQAARYGYVPPYDKDGVARVTADAGCYAA